MHTCPRGHASQDGDYCDECGVPIGATIGFRLVPDAQGAGEAGEAASCPRCDTAKVGRFCEVCGHDFLLARIAPPGWPAQASATGSVPDDAGPRDAATGDPAAGDAAGDGAVAVADEYRAAAVTSIEMARIAPVPVQPAPDQPRQWRLTATSDAVYHARMQAEAEPGSSPIPFPIYCPARRFVLSGRQVLIGRRSRSRGIEPEIDLTGPPADPAVSHTHALLLIQPGGGWAVVDLESANGTYVNDEPDPIPANMPIALADGDRVHLGAWTTITVALS